MPHPIHHLHKRKRVHKKKEPYPHPQPFKRWLDHFIYIIGCLGPLFGGVQAYKIWDGKDAAGISLVTYAFLLFNDVVWFVYGAVHKEKPIMLMYALWFIVNSFVVCGTLLYG